MKLMYTFIPIIFLFPAIILFLIVLAYRKKAGIGENHEADNINIDMTEFIDAGEGESETFGADANGSADTYGDEEEVDSMAGVEDTGGGDDGDGADVDGGDDLIGEYLDDTEFVYVSKAEKRYKNLLLAAILVLITGIILTISMYLGIRVTPWSGWWPDWWAS